MREEGDMHNLEVWEQARPIMRRVLNLGELTDQFLAAQDIRETSRTVYRKGLERFGHWLEVNGIQQPDREDILKFKMFLVESGLAANTVNGYLVAVKRFFAYVEGMRLYPDVAKNVKGVKQPRNNLRESPTVGQVQAVLAKLDTTTVQGKRDFALINLMARTGLRTIEVIRADAPLIISILLVAYGLILSGFTGGGVAGLGVVFYFMSRGHKEKFEVLEMASGISWAIWILAFFIFMFLPQYWLLALFLAAIGILLKVTVKMSLVGTMWGGQQ